MHLNHLTPSSPIVNIILPELVLVGVACLCMLLGVFKKAAVRRAVPVIALLALLILFGGVTEILPIFSGLISHGQTVHDASGAVRLHEFGWYIQAITLAISALLILLAWPTDALATGSSSISYGFDVGEFFGLALLSIAGVMLLAISNDMIVFFLGLELAALPTYIMVAVSRPISAAQEAGVKYFFLGAMAAALILFGFSYLYGATGTTDLWVITQEFNATRAGGRGPTILTHWEMLGVVTLIIAFLFKLAAFPLHFYAGDVYEGAATPVTAFLSFIPKITGIVALVKILYVTGGGNFFVPHQISELLWVLAVCTMTVGNILGVVQPSNIKRIFACSSIAHSGYMLAAIAALTGCGGKMGLEESALLAVLFYLLAYGLMNIGAFGVLILLPSRKDISTTSAETFDDLAGMGHRYPGLGIVMTISCLSLIGIPLTMGFVGKVLIIRPALSVGMYWLVIFIIVNAAISATYYLRIIGAMYLRPEPTARPSFAGPETSEQLPVGRLPMSPATLVSVVVASIAVLLLGVVLPATQMVTTKAQAGTQIDDAITNGIVQASPLHGRTLLSDGPREAPQSD